MRALTPREQAAQTVVAGLPGTRPDSEARRIAAEDAGTVLLLGHNVADAAQLRDLTSALRGLAPVRLLVSVDEEGGRVARLADKGVVTPLPDARTLVAHHSPEQVRALGVRLGSELRQVGVDWDLAPVLDVTDAAAGSVIGARAYSGDPLTAARYGMAFAAGLADAGVLTAGKHFPGHGRTTVDSHCDSAVVKASRSDLEAHDLVPFARALPHLDAVMTSHVVYPELDPKRPASLSPAVSRLLRNELGYDGLLVTDALEMGAIARHWSVPTAAVMALAAGADLALVSQAHEVRATTDAITAAIADGRIPPVRLQQAVRRVLRAKGYDAAQSDRLLGSRVQPRC